MATKISEFEYWEFTEAELPLACVFTEMQTMHIKSERSLVATERSQLAVDPDSPNAQMKFMMEHEYLRGKLEAYGLLLKLSDDYRNALVDKLRQQQSNQKEE